MKKSNLKYIFYILFIGTIFTLYQWNKKFFESSDYTLKKGSNKSRSSSSMNFNSGASGSSSSLNLQNGDNNESNEGESESTISNPSYSFSGFSTGVTGSNFETQSSSNSPDEEYTTIDNLVSENISNSSGVNNSDVSAGGGMSIGIPMQGLLANNEESKEEKAKKQQQVANNPSQTAGRGKFFNGTVETPMAPLPPDEDVPLDGGASILLVLGSMLGVKKLFGKKNIS